MLNTITSLGYMRETGGFSYHISCLFSSFLAAAAAAALHKL